MAERDAARLARLLDAFDAQTAAAAGAPTALLSLSVDAADADAAPTEARAWVTRTTRNLVFAEGEVLSAAGEKLLAGTAIYAIATPGEPS